MYCLLLRTSARVVPRRWAIPPTVWFGPGPTAWTTRVNTYRYPGRFSTSQTKCLCRIPERTCLPSRYSMPAWRRRALLHCTYKGHTAYFCATPLPPPTPAPPTAHMLPAPRSHGTWRHCLYPRPTACSTTSHAASLDAAGRVATGLLTHGGTALQPRALNIID